MVDGGGFVQLDARPDFTNGPRVVASQADWQDLRAKKLGACRICGRPDRATLHHLVSKSLGGDDVEFNLVSICGSGTTGCHGRVEARDPVARHELRKRLEDGEVGYIVGKKGLEWLAIHYPVSLPL